MKEFGANKIDIRSGENFGVEFNVKVGQEEFREIKSVFKSTDVLLSPEIKSILSNLDKPNMEDSMDLTRVKVGDLSLWNSNEVSLKVIADRAEEIGFKFCRPEVVFYVARQMLEEKREDIFYVPTIVDGSFRVFSVENKAGNVDLMLYDKRLVNRGSQSPFGNGDQFLFDK